MGLELTMLVVIGTECTDNWKSNCHMMVPGSTCTDKLTYLLSPCYASWHIGQGQVSSTLLCWLFFLLCPRCILFPLFHFRWCASMLFLVFLFFFSLLVSILGLPLSCLQMVYVEHDHAISISFESTKSPCPWCLWCYAGLCWRFCSSRISSLSFSDWCYGSWRVCWCLYQSFPSTLSHIGAQIVHSCHRV